MRFCLLLGKITHTMNIFNDQLIKDALKEDNFGKDVTTRLFIPATERAKAVILAKGDGIVCGLEIVRKVYGLMDKRCKINIKSKDGRRVRKGMVVAEISGPARSILSAERTAINFLQHLSGIATLTDKFVQKTKNTKTKILDTRKTIPGLRVLEKYAVRCGGGTNHRMTLGEMALIKDNHLKIMSEWGPEMIQEAKINNKNLMIEVECENMAQVKKFAGSGADIIMLDNMGNKKLKEAIKYIRKQNRRIQIEISGGVTLENTANLAKLGVERISVGALTHSAPAMDFSMELVRQ